MLKRKSNDGPNNHRKENLCRRILNGLREMRKYPNHETFAVGDLVLVYHPLGSVLQSP